MRAPLEAAGAAKPPGLPTGKSAPSTAASTHASSSGSAQPTKLRGVNNEDKAIQEGLEKLREQERRGHQPPSHQPVGHHVPGLQPQVAAGKPLTSQGGPSPSKGKGPAPPAKSQPTGAVRGRPKEAPIVKPAKCVEDKGKKPGQLLDVGAQDVRRPRSSNSDKRGVVEEQKRKEAEEKKRQEERQERERKREEEMKKMREDIERGRKGGKPSRPEFQIVQRSYATGEVSQTNYA